MDDLIAVPRYGWLYRMTLECGCRVLVQEPQRIYVCGQCGKALARYPTWVTVRDG